MSLFPQEDPLFLDLKKELDLNFLRVPDRRIVPLEVMEKSTSGAVKWLGTIQQILKEGSTFSLDSKDFQSDHKASDPNEKTQHLSFESSINLLTGFLNGGPDATTSTKLKDLFSQSAVLAFSFKHLEIQWVDPVQLGTSLNNQHIERMDSTLGFFDFSPSQLLLVDSVLICKAFSLHIQDNQTLHLESVSQELQALTSDFSIASMEETAIHFEAGSVGVPIAFSCIALKIDHRNGRIVELPFKRKYRSPKKGYGLEGELSKVRIDDQDEGFVEVVF